MSAPSNYNQTVIETFRKNSGRIPVGPYAESDPRVNGLLLLTTTGAKSGQPRTMPLAYSKDGDRYVVAASKGGAPTNPDWFHNLMANPIVTVEVGGETFQARATVASEPERVRLYARHAGLMPGFAEYLTKTDRKIPIVLLERIA
jgi:deazaflavin-dependent oxidoreductase (nitroreductase family)